jgi:hypothetical protein
VSPSPSSADKAAGDKRAQKVRMVAVEPTSCPTLTKGVYAYDFGDASGFTPMMKMYTLGHDFMPPGHPCRRPALPRRLPLISQLYHEKLIEAVAVPQVATFEAGVMFARAEGIIPAPSRPRHPRLHRRGAALQGQRRAEDAVVQPLRPRPLRHGRLRELLLRTVLAFHPETAVLEVGQKTTFCSVIGVGYVVPHHRLLAGDLTYTCHERLPLKMADSESRRLYHSSIAAVKANRVRRTISRLSRRR